MPGIGGYDKKQKGSRGYKMKGHALPGIKQRPAATSSEKLQNLAKDYDNRKDMPGYKEALLKAAETVGIENLPKKSPAKQTTDRETMRQRAKDNNKKEENKKSFPKVSGESGAANTLRKGLTKLAIWNKKMEPKEEVDTFLGVRR
tara:strand:+ start:1646 stop:2080 length:435 start_codon:yes stop_codon:yes gene_type:complete